MKKHVRNIIYYVLYVFLYFVYTSVHASPYGPNMYFQKPYSKTDYVNGLTLAFNAGKTDQAYNKYGGIVPFLQQYGSEDILKRFIDPTLPSTDSQIIGYANFSGIFYFQRGNFSYYKNIHKDLFIGIGTVVQNLTINSIGMDIHITDTNLSQQELRHLDIFTNKIPKDINSAGMYCTYIEVGYNKIFDHFESINFLQIMIDTSICTPEYMNNSNLTLLQYPLGGNITFSYPLSFNLAVGLTKHCTLGFYGLFLPLQSVQLTSTVHNNSTVNHLLLTEIAQVKINPKPIFNTSFYVETSHFNSQLTGTLGYTFMYGMEWQMETIDHIHFSQELINDIKVLDPWYIMSALFQIDYNFKNPKAPHLSLYYVLPLTGSFYPRIPIIGGMYGLQFSYEF